MKEEQIESNPILMHSFELALMTIAYTDRLYELRKYDMARQLFRSGTSVGANAFEAQNAESKADFIHKMKLSAKENDETEYWIRLCRKSADYPNCDALADQASTVGKILSSIIKSSKV